MEKPHYVKWATVPEGYYTKTRLKEEFGVKPFSELDYDATVKVYQQSKWQTFNLYHMDNTVEIKKRKVKVIEPTYKNIAESLYLINKSAKVSRDTKSKNYSSGNHSVVKRAKNRQSELYDLKTSVMAKLREENKLVTLGYHIQSFDHTERKVYLLLEELEGFTFHSPLDAKPDDLKELGEIEVISADKTVQTGVNFFEAKLLLETYTLTNQ